MKRRLFAILSALSLLLLVVWLFTYWWSFAIYRQASGQFRCLALHEGRVVYATERPDREHPNIDKVASNWGVNIESGEFFSVVTAAKRREFMGFGRDSHRQSLTDAPVGGNVVILRLAPVVDAPVVLLPFDGGISLVAGGEGGEGLLA